MVGVSLGIKPLDMEKSNTASEFAGQCFQLIAQRWQRERCLRDAFERKAELCSRTNQQSYASSGNSSGKKQTFELIAGLLDFVDLKFVEIQAVALSAFAILKVCSSPSRWRDYGFWKSSGYATSSIGDGENRFLCGSQALVVVFQKKTLPRLTCEK